MNENSGTPATPEEWYAKYGWEALQARFAGQLGVSVEEWEWAGICAQEADDGAAIDLAMQPVLMSIMAEESGAPAEYHDPDTWRRRAIAAHHARAARFTKPRMPERHQPRTSTRPKGTPRQPRTAKTRSGQSPPEGDGDPDPDPDLDPVERRVRQLVSQAPPLSAAQRQLLGRILGGGGR